MKYIRKINTFDSHSMPIAQINIMTINAIIPTIRTSFTPLSMIFRLFSRNKSFRESQKPMVFIDAETAFANANTIPTEAPNSAPRVRDMIKYIPPIEIINLYNSYNCVTTAFNFTRSNNYLFGHVII